MFHIKNSMLDDLKAGLVVSLVALPLCLGIALASGAPALSGLIAGIIGGLIIGVLSPSHVSVSGPAAGLTVVVLDAIADIGSFAAFLPALILAGLIQLLMGLFRLGKVSNFVHHCVIEGMLSAIGLILIIKQLPYVIGSLSPKYTEIFNTPAPDNINLGAFLIGLICLIFIAVHNTTSLKDKKIFKLIPLSMFLVVIASVLAFLFSFYTPLQLSQNLFVDLSGITGGAEAFSALIFPDFSQGFSLNIMKYALIMALVASLETLLCVKAADQIDPHKRFTPPNKELLAQGIGNIFSGFIGGLPITSVIVRTSVNIQAGAKTKWASIFHGIILMIGLLAFPTLITKIPLAVLACILVLAGYNLAHPRQISSSVKNGFLYAIPFFATLATVVFTDILIGVIVGQCISMALRFGFKDHKKG